MYLMLVKIDIFFVESPYFLYSQSTVRSFSDENMVLYEEKPLVFSFVTMRFTFFYNSKL